jgi:hypothetical protein
MKKLLYVVGVGMLMSSPVMAKGIEYNFVEGGYSISSYTPYEDTSTEFDATGFYVSGSYALSSGMFLLGQASEDQSEKVESSESSVNTSSLRLGIGYHEMIRPYFDFVGSVSYLTREVDGIEDPKHFIFSGGIRHTIDYTTEVEGHLFYAKAESKTARSEIGYEVGIRHYLNDLVSIGASYRSVNDFESGFSLKVRHDF